MAAVIHGDEVWAVYVAVAESIEDPGWIASDRQLREFGYRNQGAGLGCDVGAPEALGLDGNLVTVAVYFRTQADAEQFVAMYQPGVVGVAEVTVLCLD